MGYNILQFTHTNWKSQPPPRLRHGKLVQKVPNYMGMGKNLLEFEQELYEESISLSTAVDAKFELITAFGSCEHNMTLMQHVTGESPNELCVGTTTEVVIQTAIQRTCLHIAHVKNRIRQTDRRFTHTDSTQDDLKKTISKLSSLTLEKSDEDELMASFEKTEQSVQSMLSDKKEWGKLGKICQKIGESLTSDFKIEFKKSSKLISENRARAVDTKNR